MALPQRNAMTSPPAPVPVERPRLELSGPKLDQAFSALVTGAEEHGGIERYVEALRAKSQVFADALGGTAAVDHGVFKALCAFMPTVRRRIGEYLHPAAFDGLRASVVTLLEGREATGGTDERIAAFCRAFPEGRAHRWVRDLAAELLHNADPERYPAMCRWVWDAAANTGVLREIWHAENVDHLFIDVPDRYGTFVMLREELAQYLSGQAVYRDVVHYVDLLVAQVYAQYIGEQGGQYLRTDFASPEDPMIHVRRLLGLDGYDAEGRSRVKAADGDAVPDVRMLR
jgi:hypothetical protein